MIVHWRLITFLSKINERRPNPKSQTERERDRAAGPFSQQAKHTATFDVGNIASDGDRKYYETVQIGAIQTWRIYSSDCLYRDMQAENQKKYSLLRNGLLYRFPR
jgi:hypothetical protein